MGGAEARTDAKGALYSKPDDTVGQLVDRQPNVAKEGADPKRSHVLAEAERLEQESADKAEAERLEKEAADKAEAERLEKESADNEDEILDEIDEGMHLLHLY